jgi:hypothetical protein
MKLLTIVLTIFVGGCTTHEFRPVGEGDAKLCREDYYKGLATPICVKAIDEFERELRYHHDKYHSKEDPDTRDKLNHPANQDGTYPIHNHSDGEK